MNERMSNKRVADLIDLVTADVDYVEDPDELVAALHDLLDARAKIENVDIEDRQARAEVMDLECVNGIKHCNPVRFRGECVYCAIEKAEQRIKELEKELEATRDARKIAAVTGHCPTCGAFPFVYPEEDR